METKLKLWSFIVVILLGINLSAQNHQYYVRAMSEDFNPQMFDNGTSLQYMDRDPQLEKLFSENNIYKFEKGFTNSRQSMLLRTFYVETDSPNSLEEFIGKNAHVFEYGEYLGNDEVKLSYSEPLNDPGSRIKALHIGSMDESVDVFKMNSVNNTSSLLTYPNDYGQTGPQGPGFNLGMNLNLHAYDYVDLPVAWTYSTGNPNLKLGVSDGKIDTTAIDLEGKITTLDNSPVVAGWHGISVSGLVGAIGDNATAAVGYAYDTPIIHNDYLNTYDGLLDLSYAGAKVINCSWGSTTYSETQQICINEITANGSIVVASSGNEEWHPVTNPGTYRQYPASYDNVISVATVGAKYNVADSVYYEPVNMSWRSINVKDHVVNRIQYDQHPNGDPNTPYVPILNSTVTMNSDVDILGPAGGIRLGAIYENNPDPKYGFNALFQTSATAPQVTGTLGIMYSVHECLTFEEAESILKIASKNIDDIPANQFAAGNYGSGALNAGTAAKLTYDLITPSRTAYLENQKFSRWEFVFNAISANVRIRNQEFTGGASLTLTAKNQINVEEETLFDPTDPKGFVLLEVDPGLTIEINCPMNSGYHSNSKKIDDPGSLYEVYPTLVDEVIHVVNVVSYDALINKIKIYDLFGQERYNQIDIDSHEILLEVNNLLEGIYILKGYGLDNEEILTIKFVKK